MDRRGEIDERSDRCPGRFYLCASAKVRARARKVSAGPKEEEAQTQLLKDAPAAPKCPLYGSSIFTTSPERGEVTCARCGLVLEEHLIDLRPDQRAYTPEDRQSRRTGSLITFALHDMGLTTTISRHDRDASWT
jgi:transcription initiation factor TFIIB